jgi:predicted NBD/HSP70 family sugar kinase
VSSPGVPAWDDYPIGDRLARHFGVPTWVDNEANTMALGEQRRGAARNARNFILVKLGSGIGAGLVVEGHLCRGHLGGAGDIAHVPITATPAFPCWCGKASCLVTVAGGVALARTAQALAADGRSPALRDIAERANGRLTAADLMTAALSGDPTSVQAFEMAGEQLGCTLSTLVNVLNPELVLLAGRVMGAADFILPAVRRVIYGRSTPLSTRDLRIERSAPDGGFGIVGAAMTAIDALLGPDLLGTWSASGPRPAGRDDRTAAARSG